jgi:hypothetical protein
MIRPQSPSLNAWRKTSSDTNLSSTSQAEVLRADQPRLDAAMTKIQQSPLVAKPGQRWEPTGDSVDEYLARCDDICQSVPQDFDELSLYSIVCFCYLTKCSRVKILHGAYTALMCLVTCKFARQPDSVQLAILKSHNDLS